MAAASVSEQENLLRLFASYSPAEVCLRYSDLPDPRPPDGPEQEDFDAAIGFVDVSGFTALSEKLNKDHGRKGAELLNTCAAPTPSPLFLPAHERTRTPKKGAPARQRPLRRRFVDAWFARRYINAYFQELIELIFVHGGDVIKFAGDAMQARVHREQSPVPPSHPHAHHHDRARRSARAKRMSRSGAGRSRVRHLKNIRIILRELI